MQTLTLDQLRTTAHAGAVTGVRVKGQGSGFYVEITTKRGQLILAKTRGHQPRRFGSPFHAMNELRKLGLVVGEFDMSQYDPDQQEIDAPRQAQAAAMQKTPKDAAYLRELEARIDKSLNDPRPSVDNETVKRHFADLKARARAGIKATD